MSYHVKNFSFSVFDQPAPGAPLAYVTTIETQARTLGEAQADFRHTLRTQYPDLLENLTRLSYTLEVSHV